MKNWLRVFFVGGVIAYRGLFNWLRPAHYFPTMLGGPMFQILFFAYLGRFAHAQSDAFYVVGNAVQISAMAGVFGMAITIGGERWTQTLGPLMATPASRLAIFLGRALPNLVQGLIVSTFGFCIGRLLLDFHPPLGSVPTLALIVLTTSTSCTAFGMVVGAFGLRLRDSFLVANPTYFLMLLFCGVNVPLHVLPGWMATISRGLPLTHGIEAARHVVAGASLSSVSGLVGTEAFIGFCYAVLAYFFLRFFEEESRRRATLDRM
jgi:ABC-2 type transport system permease protein